MWYRILKKVCQFCDGKWRMWHFFLAPNLNLEPFFWRQQWWNFDVRWWKKCALYLPLFTNSLHVIVGVCWNCWLSKLWYVFALLDMQLLNLYPSLFVAWTPPGAQSKCLESRRRWGNSCPGSQCHLILSPRSLSHACRSTEELYIRSCEVAVSINWGLPCLSRERKMI